MSPHSGRWHSNVAAVSKSLIAIFPSTDHPQRWNNLQTGNAKLVVSHICFCKILQSGTVWYVYINWKKWESEKWSCHQQWTEQGQVCDLYSGQLLTFRDENDHKKTFVPEWWPFVKVQFIPRNLFIIQSRHNIFSKYKTKGSLLTEGIGGFEKKVLEEGSFMFLYFKLCWICAGESI